MKFAELTLILPCHSLEDFPIHHEGDEAQGLLAAWSAVWHPALLLASGQLPKWQRADSPPENLAGRLLIIPGVSFAELPVGFVARAEEEGACVIRKQVSRKEIVAEALINLDGGAAGVADETAADFLALGYCYLQTELLTRRMRYMSVLDEVHFQNQVMAAAQAAVAGEAGTLRDRLTACFSLLNEARAHFYPVDAYLVDLTLLAPTTIGESFRRELQRGEPMNVLVSAETIGLMAKEQPESLRLLRQGLEEGRVSLVGGEASERDLPLLPVEAIRGEFEAGLAEYLRLLDRRPEVYGRRKYGLSAVLPQFLHKFGFVGALHTALDDGRFPTGHQGKSRWEGLDGSTIDALIRPPYDANRQSTFLTLHDKMGHTMDSDHVATLCFAHWPGQCCEWYDDLRRMAKFAPALGRFITLNEYFRTTESMSSRNAFEADEYRTPYLQQAIVRQATDPLSQCMREHVQDMERTQFSALSTLTALLKGKAEVEGSSLLEQTKAFSSALPRAKGELESGLLLVNPASYARNYHVDLAPLAGLPKVEGPVLAAVEFAGQRQAIVEVPPLGFAWVTAEKGVSTAKPVKKPPAALAQENTLANEWLEVKIHPTTGGLQSIHDFKRRGNRLSQQLAFRIPNARGAANSSDDPDLNAVYSVMAADSVTITTATPLLGEITTRGRLMHPEGKTLATYLQRYRLWRDSRVLQIEIELEPHEEPRADPWNAYYAARFAWSDASATIFRGVQLGRKQTEAKRIEAPQWLEIDEGKAKTAILSGGLPYHRRIGLRMLDTLLIVPGESARKFKLGIGIDLANVPQAAQELLQPELILPEQNPPPTPVRSGWLFHLDVKSIVATDWSPWVEEGRVVGFRVRLLETEGKPGKVLLRSFRQVKSAGTTDYLGQPSAEASVKGDAIQVEYKAHEFVQLEARWG